MHKVDSSVAVGGPQRDVVTLQAATIAVGRATVGVMAGASAAMVAGAEVTVEVELEAEVATMAKTEVEV